MRFQILITSFGQEKVHLLGDPDGLKECHLEGEGLSLRDALPNEASYRKDPQGGNKLTDFLGSPGHSLVVSAKALELLSTEPNPFEAYSIPIKDQAKGTTIDGYSLFHLLGHIDCVELQRSEIRFSRIFPHRSSAIKRLYLDESRIPPNRTLFRIKENPSLKIIREDLVQRLRDAGVTGFDLLDLGSRILL